MLSVVAGLCVSCGNGKTHIRKVILEQERVLCEGRGVLFSRDHIEKGRAKWGRLSSSLVFRQEKKQPDSICRKEISLRCLYDALSIPLHFACVAARPVINSNIHGKVGKRREATLGNHSLPQSPGSWPKLSHSCETSGQPRN